MGCVVESSIWLDITSYLAEVFAAPTQYVADLFIRLRTRPCVPNHTDRNTRLAQSILTSVQRALFARRSVEQKVCGPLHRNHNPHRSRTVVFSLPFASL